MAFLCVFFKARLLEMSWRVVQALLPRLSQFPALGRHFECGSDQISIVNRYRIRKGLSSDLALAVHVRDESHNGDVPDGLAEEQLLDGEAGDLVHQLDDSQQRLESHGLRRMCPLNVVVQGAPGIVVHGRHLRGLQQTL